ncbi:MAG: S-adenosylmethionine:tRNA ribosyltransferase-isomerase [Bacteroidaceae bacterium]|nr:S-adenosylmethionine:tRNA ribosyltransferase-isomerase [Candidatus Colenecus caballi]MCQ2072116.1 S-adenosylmethionine:tRNA ribosyltransferase-isomerase [Bacteroidaceae bacterium]
MDESVKHIRISEFNYTLPDERIARFPLAQRDSSKLLVYNHGQVSQDVFTSLPGYLPKGALMIFNNTKVIQARLHFRKPACGGPKSTGAMIEVFLLEPASPSDYQLMFTQTEKCSWYCLIGNLKRWKSDVVTLSTTVEIDGRTVTMKASRGPVHGTSHRVDFRWDGGVSFAQLLEAAGEIPIPPYLNRESQESDRTTYQTVYSKIKGSVAAPTAGLHFTDRVLKDLDDHGIDREELTLHVGAGTFRPVKSEEIEGHEMHTEFIAVRKATIQKLIAHDGQAIAVGTTSVRTLESLYYIGLYLGTHPDATEEDMHVSQWTPYQTESDVTAVQALQNILDYLNLHGLDVLKTSTQIIIAPGYRYHIVRMMVTNFHQPQSTLLLLVSAFLSGDWRKVYNYALSHDFRFLSYGDSSLLIP